jgi:F-type H+-transporting ATPase subunit delta
MNESLISVRYTKALFNLSIEKGILEMVKLDMENVLAVMKESEELQNLFQNPVLKPSNKSEIVKQIFPFFNAVSLSFINLLIKNRREEYLYAILLDFLEKCMSYKGIENAVVISAVNIDKSTLENIKQLVRSLLKTEIELSNIANEKLVGGFILRVGDKQFDASVQSKLNKIKQRLFKTSVI